MRMLTIMMRAKSLHDDNDRVDDYYDEQDAEDDAKVVSFPFYFICFMC